MSAETLRAWKNTELEVPSHVPDEAVIDFDYFCTEERLSGEAFDVFEVYRRLQQKSKLFYSPRYGGHWVATRYEVLEAVYADTEHFGSQNNMIPPAPQGGFAFLNYDGEQHMAFRSILQPYFSPKVISKFDSLIEAEANALIDNFIEQGHCEFMEDFSKQLPTIMVMKFILQLPEEATAELMPHADAIAHAGNDIEKFNNAFSQLWGYVAQHIIPGRRQNPGDDVLSAVVHSSPGGSPITDEEIMGTIAVLIVGGLDTVVGSLGLAAHYLATHPKQRQKLIDNPALIPEASEELIRRFAVTNHARQVMKDVEFFGRQLKEGDMILLPTTAAAIDEERFDDASSVLFDRPQKRKNLTFANGPHYCLGNVLARAEMKNFVKCWLNRIPEFAVKEGAIIRTTTGITNHLESLPLVWKT